MPYSDVRGVTGRSVLRLVSRAGMLDGMHSRQELAEGFRRLGVRLGDVVMVHASVRSVGAIAGGPDQIHLALRDAVGPSGTLMMYASCPAHYDEVGRGDLSVDEEAELIEKLPAFDARTARSARDNGALVELFRTWPDVIASDHVARFVAWGRHAGHLVNPQPWNYAYGRGSVLERFELLDGRILLIGSDHDTVTFLHYAEHIVDLPGKRVVRFRVPVMQDGVRVWRDMEEFDTSEPVHPSFPARIFAEITDSYIASERLSSGRVGDAECWLIDARGLLDHALAEMKRVAGT